MRVISTRTSINGEDWPIISLKQVFVTYHFCCCFFFETMLAGEHSGKVSRKFIGYFFFLRNHLKADKTPTPEVTCAKLMKNDDKS